MSKFVEVETVREWLADGGEIAFLDVREEGQHGSGHPLLAVNLRIVGLSGISLTWCRGAPVAWFCSTTQMPSRPKQPAASTGSATKTSTS
jgi:hypothetical protein